VICFAKSRADLTATEDLKKTAENGCEREEAGEIVKQHGGKVSGSVSKKTDYVVVGTDPGPKFEKAKELGVKILSEGEFEKLLGLT